MRKQRRKKPSTRKIVARPDDVPTSWVLLPPGDAALTRRVKSAGEHRVMSEKKGRRTFSLGVWAPADTIDKIRRDLEAERAEPSYQKRLNAAAKRRDVEQAKYEESFTAAIEAFLDFPDKYAEIAHQLAVAIASHATPVGSGTVARTKRISLERRAEAAVIAWLRHQTTGYDGMKIARVRGRRREVRQQLAEISRELLDRYRQGESISPHCPIQKALKNLQA